MIFEIYIFCMSSSILFPTNEYATSSKSTEEIQKLIHPQFSSIDDELMHIIVKGLPVQRPYLYRRMPKAPKVALGFVCQRAPSEDSQNQLIIAQSMQVMLSNRSLGPEDIESVFECCLECLNNLSSPANEQFVMVLEATLRGHPERRKLVKRLEDVVRDLGKPTQPIISKVTSARLISVLARYTNRMVKGDMIDILKRVLAHNQIEARKVWVSEIFPRLLNNLDLEFIELHLQEKIYEAVWDDNQQIGVLALESILRNATKFSLEQQNSRIVKLFIDSLTSKNEKIVLLATELMGQSYQKLLHIILKSEQMCLRFWKSLVELAQSKNETIVRHLSYNLPGILKLSAPLYKVDELCEVYIELFYQPVSDKLLLATYFHQIARLFPKKSTELKELVYWMFGELFEQQEPSQDALKIIYKLLQHLPAYQNLFITEGDSAHYFENTFSESLVKYLNCLFQRHNCSWLRPIHQCIREACLCFSPEFVEQTLLPTLYVCLRSKTCCLETVIETVVTVLSRDCNPSVINSYASKISVELSKSSRSFERESALLFFYHASQNFSMEMFQEYRLGEKYLYFHNDKSFKVKAAFIQYLPKLSYFFTRQQKIEQGLIIDRLSKDSDVQVQEIVRSIDFTEKQSERERIVKRSHTFREHQVEKAALLAARRHLAQNRRSSKELKKEEVLKKKIETTKSKTKLLIKDVSRKKINPTLVKTSSNFNFRKHA